MQRHPTHFKGKLLPLDQPACVTGKYNSYELDDSFVVLGCNCRGQLFSIEKSNYPEVRCQCVNCAETYTVYDVDHYPAACGYDPEKGKFNKWRSLSGDDAFQVIASWTYPEEAEDENDVDWFVLIAKDLRTGEYIEVVNDETV